MKGPRIGGGKAYYDVRSYAIWKGDPAPGNIYVEDLSISDVSCTLNYGKGKNKNTVLGTTISLDVAFAYGVWNPPATIDFWGEGHIRVVPVGAEVSLLSEHGRTPRLNGSQRFSWTFPTDLSGQDVEVEFALDYLQATGSDDAYDRVYDPGLNGVFTSAGYDGLAWHPEDNVSSKLYDEKFPVAHSRPDPTQYPNKDVVLVSCG